MAEIWQARSPREALALIGEDNNPTMQWTGTGVRVGLTSLSGDYVIELSQAECERIATLVAIERDR